MKKFQPQKDMVMSAECSELFKTETWQQIFSVLDEGVHVVDNHGKTLLYNRTASRLDGLEPEEVIDKNIFSVFPSLTLENSTLMSTIRSGEPIKNVLQTFINSRGEEITTVNSTIPLELTDGTRGALEISRDITLLQELVDDVSNLRRQLSKHDSGSKLQSGSADKKKKPDNNTSYTFTDLIGEADNFREVINEAVKAARSDSSVMIIGETGTGKELVAQGIHNASPRSESPFIAQNCAALPRDLLEGLLFGTEKGGFTGATSRPGLFEQANKGTILLDEIDALDFDLQAKLLRVLQENKIRRIGSQQEKQVDVRIIATMNSEPEVAFEENNLREDLYYRLAVVSLNLPPLRERVGDTALLVSHFIEHYNEKFERDVQGFSEKLLEKLKNYSWPGNVRELQHFVEACFNLCRAENEISWQNLPPHLQEKLITDDGRQNDIFSWQNSSCLPALSEFLENIEKQLITRAMEIKENNISAAARALEISRQSLQYKLDKYNLK